MTRNNRSEKRNCERQETKRDQRKGKDQKREPQVKRDKRITKKL